MYIYIVCVCMCVYMCVSVCVCMCKCVYVCTWVKNVLFTQIIEHINKCSTMC